MKHTHIHLLLRLLGRRLLWSDPSTKERAMLQLPRAGIVRCLRLPSTLGRNRALLRSRPLMTMRWEALSALLSHYPTGGRRRRRQSLEGRGESRSSVHAIQQATDRAACGMCFSRKKTTRVWIVGEGFLCFFYYYVSTFYPSPQSPHPQLQPLSTPLLS